jgi:hypothetical protein
LSSDVYFELARRYPDFKGEVRNFHISLDLFAHIKTSGRKEEVPRLNPHMMIILLQTFLMPRISLFLLLQQVVRFADLVNTSQTVHLLFLHDDGQAKMNTPSGATTCTAGPVKKIIHLHAESHPKMPVSCSTDELDHLRIPPPAGNRKIV